MLDLKLQYYLKDNYTLSKKKNRNKVKAITKINASCKNLLPSINKEQANVINCP